MFHDVFLLWCASAHGRSYLCKYIYILHRHIACILRILHWPCSGFVVSNHFPACRAAVDSIITSCAKSRAWVPQTRWTQYNPAVSYGIFACYCTNTTLAVMKPSLIRLWMNYPRSSQCRFLSALTILLVTVRQECSLHCGWALWPQPLFQMLQYKDLNFIKSSMATTCSFGLAACWFPSSPGVTCNTHECRGSKDHVKLSMSNNCKRFLFWLIFVYSCFSTDTEWRKRVMLQCWWTYRWSQQS